MIIMKAIIAVFILIVFAIINPGQVFCQDDLSSEIKDPELEQEFKWLKAETFVITASKVMENIKKAPASITVITDKQIRQMGARNLTDVLWRTVPSVNFSKPSFERNEVIIVRGTTALSSVLLLINGHPVTRAFGGDWRYLYDDLIIDNIKRIEVIRGPGSALYGANAYHGVINVITKEAEDIDGVELTARGGSYDTQQYNLLYGKTFSDLEVAFDFNYLKTHGFRGLIEEDFQTQLDQIWVPLGFAPASLAPGRTNSDLEKYDTQLTLNYKGFKFDGKYTDKKYDHPTSWTSALTNKTIYDGKGYSLTLSYETRIWEGLDLYGKVYRNKDEGTGDNQWFPPGHVTRTPNPAPPPPFIPVVMPDGLLWNPKLESTRTGIEFQTTYKMSDSNTIVVGASYEDQKAEKIPVWANFLPTGVPGVIIPLPSVQKWPEGLSMGTEKINFKAFFLEDIWDITDDLRLTLGARYDYYSDFGGELSPRVGLTWEYMKGYDLKLLYGHAFRAPNFLELFDFSSGNADLDPETIDAYEISFGAEFTRNFNSRITLYHIETEDRIIPSSGTQLFNWANQGSSRTQGVELEMRYDFGRGTYLAGNYYYFKRKTGNKGNQHNAKIMANIRLSRYLNFHVDGRFIDSIERFRPGDTRDDVSGYGLVNATLIAKKFLKGYEGLELRGSVYNLLDKDWVTPTDQQIPNDMPRPGINFLLEMRYKF